MADEGKKRFVRMRKPNTPSRKMVDADTGIRFTDEDQSDPAIIVEDGVLYLRVYYDNKWGWKDINLADIAEWIQNNKPELLEKHNDEKTL